MREVYSEATQHSSPAVRKCDALLCHFLPSTGSWYSWGHCQDLLFLVISVVFSMQSPWLRWWCRMGAPHIPSPLNTLAGKISVHTTDSSLPTCPGYLQKETNVHRKMITTQISSLSWVRTKGILVTKQSELGSESWTTSSCSAGTRHVLWVQSSFFVHLNLPRAMEHTGNMLSEHELMLQNTLLNYDLEKYIFNQFLKAALKSKPHPRWGKYTLLRKVLSPTSEFMWWSKSSMATLSMLVSYLSPPDSVHS